MPLCPFNRYSCFGLLFLAGQVAPDEDFARPPRSLRRQPHSISLASTVESPASEPPIIEPPVASYTQESEPSHSHPTVAHEHGSDFTDHFLEEKDHHVQHSIFKMPLVELDCEDFWLIVFCMLVFTVFVDRLQWYITMKAQSNRCNRMFVDRVVAELMMFGVVAISVFVFSQVASMTEHTHHLFEFTDVLCSFGACFLILMGIVLFGFRRWFEWKQGSAIEVLAEIDKLESLNELSHQQLHSIRNSVKRVQFFARHKLTTQTFSWNLFLIETLNEGICELINLNWITWVVGCIVAGILLGLRHQVGHVGAVFDDVSRPHLVGYLICTWILWTLCVIQYIGLLVANNQLRYHLGLTSVEAMIVSAKEAQRIESAIEQGQEVQLDKNEDLDTFIPRLARLARMFAQTIQVLALGLCFMFGFYVMHIVYNINHFEHHHVNVWVWHFSFLVPLVTGLLLLLPLMIVENANIQAFSDPSHDVMDSVIEQVHEAGTDLQFIKTQLESASGTKSSVLKLFQDADVQMDGMISFDEFQAVLSKVGAKVSKERAERVFTWVTRDRGEVTYNDLLDVVFNPASTKKPS